jgi:hypothetical protein
MRQREAWHCWNHVKEKIGSSCYSLDIAGPVSYKVGIGIWSPVMYSVKPVSESRSQTDEKAESTR